MARGLQTQPTSLDGAHRTRTPLGSPGGAPAVLRNHRVGWRVRATARGTGTEGGSLPARPSAWHPIWAATKGKRREPSGRVAIRVRLPANRGAMPIPLMPPRSREQIPEYLAAFTNFESQRSLPADRRALGPQRAENLIASAGLDSPSRITVQVAGSKGKGSTVLWLEGLLRLRGCRPGAYLSPHIEDMTERIRIDGRDSTYDELLRGLTVLHPIVTAVQTTRPDLLPTFFDLWTALAAWAFEENQCTHALYEVGLGGPLDSTTAVPHDVGVLTTIDLEHRAQLGSTEEEIAREKARIARPGRPFVIGTPLTSAGQAAAEVARARGADVILVSPSDDDRVSKVALAPAQRQNLRVALTVLERGLAMAPFTGDELDRATRAVRLPARLETLVGPPPILLDSAHTIRSLAHFREAFDAWRGACRGVVLVAFLAEKEWQLALQPFPAMPDVEWIVTTPNPTRRQDPTPIAEALRRLSPTVTIEEDCAKAIESLRSRGEAGLRCAATGSVYLAGLVRSAWKSAARPTSDAPAGS